jgi:hypothetical protein
MRGSHRQDYLHRQAEILAYAQARNRTAAESHRKAAVAKLKQLRINLAALRCCQLE